MSPARWGATGWMAYRAVAGMVKRSLSHLKTAPIPMAGPEGPPRARGAESPSHAAISGRQVADHRTYRELGDPGVRRIAAERSLPGACEPSRDHPTPSPSMSDVRGRGNPRPLRAGVPLSSVACVAAARRQCLLEHWRPRTSLIVGGRSRCRLQTCPPRTLNSSP